MKKSRKILPLISLIIGASIGSAFIMVTIDMDENIALKLKEYGPNLIALPESEDIQITIGGMDLGSLSEIKYIPETSAVQLRDLPLEFYRDMVCTEPGVNAFIYSIVTADNENKIMLAGTWFDELKYINVWWSINGEYPTDDNSVVMGTTAAKKLNKDIGDQILLEYHEVLSNETGSYDYNNSNMFTITGIVSTGGEDDSRIFANLDAVQNLTNKQNKVSVLHVSTLCNNCLPDDIAHLIEGQVPGIDVLTVKQVADAETNTLDLVKNFVGFIAIIAVVTCLLAVMTTMGLSVIERRKEIGLMKTVGATNFKISVILLGEGSIIAFFGGVLGFGLGIIVSQIIGDYAFGSSIAIQWWVILVSIGLSMGIVFIASILPLRKALKIDPAEVLKGG
jgi:putative ABC transport system permease protein